MATFNITTEEICKALVVGTGGVATLVLTPVMVAAMGFAAGGITAGSVAAWLMSWFAAIGGGGVAAGGLVATLQSIGAAGLSWLGTAFTFSAGALLGKILSFICDIDISSVEVVVKDS